MVISPVQGSVPDYRVICVNLKKKSKRHCFSKKNKNQQVAIEFLTGSYQGTPGFFFPCFFFNSGLVLVLD